jgi:hypothetical protein
MLDSWFGVHPCLIRTGLLGRMKPSEVLLYLFLMERSERLCTRVIRAKDCEMGGVSPRAARDARIKLQEYGLIQCSRGTGNVYIYTICDPRTGQPYPGDPKIPVVPPKRGQSSPQGASGAAPAHHEKPQSRDNKADMPRGVPLNFD